jgi:protein-tyrosine-phosphatase
VPLLERWMTDESRVFNVLFLGAGNAARSILAEAMLNRKSRGRFRAFSAGVRPAGEVDLTMQRLLNGHYYDIARLRPKSWTEFEGPGAPGLDVVIDLRDQRADEGAPAWPGQPLLAHWGMAEPSVARGDDEIREAYGKAYWLVDLRTDLLTALPVESLDRAALQAQLDEIGLRDRPTRRA